MSIRKLESAFTTAYEAYNKLHAAYKLVLIWVALVLLFRFGVTCLVNDVFARYYQESTTVVVFHWIIAICYATFSVLLFVFHSALKRFVTLEHTIVSHDGVDDVQMKVHFK